MIRCEFENGNKASLRHVVVDVILIKDGKLVMIKRAEKLVEGGKWALVGGYVERDEDIVDAAKREVFEETGYRVKDITLLRIKSNPDRPHEDTQNISFVYFANAGDKEGEHDWEVTDIKVYALDKLPPQEQIAFDHYDDIQAYMKLKKE